MSPEDPLREVLSSLGTESPSETFVAELRTRLEGEMSHVYTSTNNEVAMISATDNDNRSAAVDPPRPPRQRLALVALVAILVAAVGVAALWGRDSNSTSTDQSPTSPPTSAAESSTTTTEQATTTEDAAASSGSETLAIGEAWVDSIVSNDRERFVSLHTPDIIANDTLMAWTGLVPGGMTRETLSSLYFDGFDAFQASIETDNDFVDVDGCEVAGSRDQIARCGYRASLVGGEETFTVRADLTVEDGLITNVFLATGLSLIHI